MSGKSISVATCFTALACILRPRPARRSGAVSTPHSSKVCGAASSARSALTAKGGVPAKATRSDISTHQLRSARSLALLHQRPRCSAILP
jgi:hypothetical protein